MISKYGSFILEKRIINLILEKELMASEEFKDKLSLLIGKSPIAFILHAAFKDEYYIDKQLAQNWIDVTDKDDTISFISDDRADKWFETDETEDVDQIFKTKSRSEIKIGRFARAFIGNKDIMVYLKNQTPSDISKIINSSSELKDKDYEDFVNLYKSVGKTEGAKFELVNGKKIKEYYHEDNYAAKIGQLGNSCMKYDSCQDYFDIYVKNPKVCSLLVYLDNEGKVLGRALVWKLSVSPCKAGYLMDRVYTSKDSDIVKFQTYAESQGWMTKWRNSSSDSDGLVFKYKGQEIVGIVEVKLSSVDYAYYPYMDTLSFIDPKNKLVSNVHGKGRSESNDTEGSIQDCSSCDGDGEFSGDCSDCYGGTVNCSECSGIGRHACNRCKGGLVNTSKCEECGGSGRIKKAVRTTMCKSCNGNGVKGDTCEYCEGTGISKCTSCNDGKVNCKICDGEGEFNNDPCPGCVGYYKSTLKDLIMQPRFSSFTSIKDLAKLELEKLKPIKADKKKKKKK